MYDPLAEVEHIAQEAERDVAKVEAFFKSNPELVKIVEDFEGAVGIVKHNVAPPPPVPPAATTA